MAVSIESDDAVINGVNLTVQGSDLTTPASGHAILYAKTDHLYIRLDDGTVVDVGPPAAGAIATDTIWDAAGDIVQGTGSNAAARLAIGSSFQIPRVNTGATALEYAGGLSAIAETVVTGSVAADITFSGIPSGFRHLAIRIQARSDEAATLSTMMLQFNSDTGANYDWTRATFSQPGAAYADGAADTRIYVGTLPGASAAANYAASYLIEIPNYKGTTFYKQCSSRGGYLSSTAGHGFFDQHHSGWWRSTSAITAVKLYIVTGNFLVGTVATLYGLS